MLAEPYLSMRQLMDQVLEVRYADLKGERRLCEALLETAAHESYCYGVAFAHTYLGDYYIAQCDTTRCIHHLLQAKKICLQCDFQDLMLKIYLFLGLCYETMCDEQMALQCCLEGVQLAQELKDPGEESHFLNNIAAAFEIRHDFAEAKRYYTKAFEKHQRTVKGINNYFLLSLLSNLVDISRQTGDLVDMQRYLHLCEAVDGEETYKRLILCRGWCFYAAATQDEKRVLELADQILEEHPELILEKRISFNILEPTCEVMLDLRSDVYAKQFLDILTELCGARELDHMQRLMRLKVRYCEIFSTEAVCNQAYRDFYQVMCEAEGIGNQARASGLKTKIHLHKVMQEKEAALRLNKDLESMAHLDDLTGLYNRRYFNKMGSKAKMDPSVFRIGFIMIDVDYFKEYNDKCGHARGDKVLKAVALCLLEYGEYEVYSSRYGGDEFTCLCINMSDEEIEQYIKRVQKKLLDMQIEHTASFCSGYVTMSIGYSNEAMHQECDVYALLEAADQALYEAKARGRNCWSKKLLIKEIVIS